MDVETYKEFLTIKKMLTALLAAEGVYFDENTGTLEAIPEDDEDDEDTTITEKAEKTE